MPELSYLIFKKKRICTVYSQSTWGRPSRSVTQEIDWYVQCQKINFAWNCFVKGKTYRMEGVLFHIWLCTWTLKKPFFVLYFFFICRNGTGTSHKWHSYVSTSSVQLKYTYKCTSFYKFQFTTEIHTPFTDYLGKFVSHTHPSEIIRSLLCLKTTQTDCHVFI
jgi:hypothetical protein